jgi:hypothetical protein
MGNIAHMHGLKMPEATAQRNAPGYEAMGIPLRACCQFISYFAKASSLLVKTALSTAPLSDSVSAPFLSKSIVIGTNWTLYFAATGCSFWSSTKTTRKLILLSYVGFISSTNWPIVTQAGQVELRRSRSVGFPFFNSLSIFGRDDPSDAEVPVPVVLLPELVPTILGTTIMAAIAMTTTITTAFQRLLMVNQSIFAKRYIFNGQGSG